MKRNEEKKADLEKLYKIQDNNGKSVSVPIIQYFDQQLVLTKSKSIFILIEINRILSNTCKCSDYLNKETYENVHQR